MTRLLVLVVAVAGLCGLAYFATRRAPAPARGAVTVARVNPSQYPNAKWADAYATVAGLSLEQRAAVWADLLAVDAVYVADPLGEGPGAVPDADPLCDFAHVDCVTYVEQVFALALASDYAGVPDMLRRIRYRDGQVDFRWRNHYTVSDWLPANTWFLRDVTEEVAPRLTRSMTKTINRARFFGDKGLPQYADIPNEECTTAYVPRERIEQVLDRLQTGDLIIFVVDTPGIIAGHVGLIRNPGPIAVQHASPTKKGVVTQPLAEYVRAMPARFVGCKIVRPFEPAG